VLDTWFYSSGGELDTGAKVSGLCSLFPYFFYVDLLGAVLCGI